MLSLDFYHPFWCNCSVLSVLRIRFNFSQTSSVSSLTLDVFILRLLKKRVWLNSTAWVNVGDVTADRLLISLCRNFMCLYSRSSVSSCDSVVLTLWFWFKQKKKNPSSDVTLTNTETRSTAEVTVMHSAVPPPSSPPPPDMKVRSCVTLTWYKPF